MGAVGAAAAVWGIGIERYLFTVREATASALPSRFGPLLRILHVSDAHMAPWQHRKQDWLASLAELKPDLVVNTGDNLGHSERLGRHPPRAFDPLAGIPGVFVHGSNDVTAPSPRNPLRLLPSVSSKKQPEPEHLDTAAMDRYFTDELGWTDLNNAAARLTLAGTAVDLFA